MKLSIIPSRTRAVVSLTAACADRPADHELATSIANQALAGRHDILTQLTRNEMPLRNNTLNLTAGIADSAERLLITLARDFESTGDQALAWEGDNKVQFQSPDPSVQ